MRVRRIPLLLVGLSFGWLFLGSVLPLRVYAQTAPSDRLATLLISVWPEYDDPRVLVQYDGEFAQKDGYPRSASFLVPSGASIYATAYVDDNGQYLNTDPWKLDDAGGGYARVTITLPKPRFHVEFYYSPLQGSPDKTMTFVYKAAQPADSLKLEIQEPLKSSNFKTDPPAAASRSTEQHGFKFDSFEYPAVAAGQEIKIQVSYTKSDPNPSVANVASALPTTGSPATNAAAPADNSNSWIPIALIAVGLAVAALAVYAWWQRQRGETEYVPARAGGRRRRTGQSGGAPAAFCPQCGRGLAADDNFCPRCGTKRRGA